ncbi:MAG: proton-conducting transporter membrane subunit, partial [Flavobacteriaceae bacterium]
VGAAMHIAAHAVSKITLVFAAGSVYTAAHVTEISQMNGVGRRMPWTMAAFSIGALSMIGLPPTAGFLGKWYMLTGATSTANWFAVAVIVVSTMLNAAYFLPIIHRAFFRDPPEHAHEGGEHDDHHHHDHGEAPWPIAVALTATALGTLALFFWPDVPLALAEQLAGMR